MRIIERFVDDIEHTHEKDLHDRWFHQIIIPKIRYSQIAEIKARMEDAERPALLKRFKEQDEIK